MSVGPFTRRSILSAGAALAATPTVFAPARAQSDYPTRPIRMIVGFAAGGGNDIFARLVGAKMGEILGQTVVVENKPGAAGRLSAEYVANQAADGYTLLVGASGAMSIGGRDLCRPEIRPDQDIHPAGMIANFPLILVINADNPSKNLKEFIAWMKAHPDKANYASSSPAFTIATELLKLKTGMPGTMIPYKSSNEMNLSVIQGQTAMTIADGPPTVPQVKAGKERALAVTGSERTPELPDVPRWRKPAIRASILCCGAACSRRQRPRYRSSPSCARPLPRPSPIPAWRKSLKTWRSIPAARRPMSSGKSSTAISRNIAKW